MSEGAKRKIYQKRAKEIAKILGDHYKAKKVYLFGSTALGEKDPNDIDLLVVADRLPKKGVDRIRQASRLFVHDVGVDSLLYTPGEFDMALKKNDAFIKQIIEKGQVLYG